MVSFRIVLRLVAIILFLVGVMQLVLGLKADIMFGANLPPEVVRDPVLDSQNRFFGTAFTLYGVLLMLAASDPRRYEVMLHVLLWCFFAAGLARFVSMAIFGLPSTIILGLTASELLLPPVLSLWLKRAYGSV